MSGPALQLGGRLQGVARGETGGAGEASHLPSTDFAERSKEELHARASRQVVGRARRLSRSGPESNEMSEYRQPAKALAEPDLGAVDPLSLAVPEANDNLPACPRVACEGGGTGRRASLRC
jgi:hypothetical protein